MAITHTFTGTTNGVRVTIPQTAESEIDIETTVNPEQEDKELDIDFAASRLKELVLAVSGLDDGETMTIKGNDTSGFGGSWTITAPGALVFLGATNNPWAANPFTADISRMYATNNSDENIGTLRITGLYDNTP